MTSSGSGDVLRFDRDLPTTAEDVAILGRLRYGPALSLDLYLQCLAGLAAPSPADLRSRPGPAGVPFDLLA
jgi:hypothetical protein